MDEIRRTFQRYDVDKNGFISYEEAHQVLHQELGFSLEQTQRLISVYDRNHDGHLSYEEFIWFYWKIQEKKSELDKMFEKFDQDHNKSISFEEAKTVLKDFQFTETEIRDLMNIHDTNKDGQLQYNEFVHFWHDCGGRKNNLTK